MDPHRSHAFHGGMCLGCACGTSDAGDPCPHPFDAGNCCYCDGSRVLGSGACPCAAMLPRAHYWPMVGNPQTACDLWLGPDLEKNLETWTAAWAKVTCHVCLAARSVDP